MKVHGELEVAGYERVSSNPVSNLFTGRTVFNTTDNTVYTYFSGAWNATANVVGAASSTDNAIVRFDGTTGKIIQNSSVVIDDSANITGVNDLTVGNNLTVSGYITEPISIGDPGFESGGVNVNGVTYNAALKVNDIGGSQPAQYVIHKHSTTLQALILGTRSNSNTSTHGTVTNSMDLFSTIAAGWTGSHYDLFAGIYYRVDASGTISATSSPGTIDFRTTPDGGNAPQSAMTIRSDKTVEFKSTTATTVPYLDANKKLVSSAVTPTELGYLSGVTSAIQTQIDALDALTTNGDIYYYNSGAYQRLGIGSANQVLTVSGGLPSWQNSASGFADPMTTIGDIIIRDGTNTTVRLGIGSANQVLTVSGGIPSWQNSVAGFSDPMTTRGDMIFKNAAGTTTRLPTGTSGQYLGSDGTDTAWASFDLVNANINASAAIAYSKLAALTINRALVSDGSGVVSVSAVTSTELGYLSGATSSIQTQLGTKVTGPASATDNAITRYDGTTGKLVQNSGATIDDSGNLTAVNITSTGQIASNINDVGASGTTKTINWNDANVQFVDMTGNCTFTFSNPVSGGTYQLILKQDATGSRTATWPATVLWPSGTAPTLSTAANSIDIVTFTYSALDTEYYGVSQLNFS